MTSQLNRQQRRALEKAQKGRARKMNQPAYHNYQARARMWAKGCTATGRHIGDEFEGEWTFKAHVPADKYQAIAEYATHAPLRWRCIARLVLKYDDGSMETREADGELGQNAIISELQDLRNQLMSDLERTANGRYVWDRYYVMECLG